MPNLSTATPEAPRHSISAEEVMEVLGKEYGPAEWTARYDPASELVSTILSQHTSERQLPSRL